MPVLETKGAISAQGFGLTLGGAAPVYIEDVFSTWLYTGNGSTQTITNGIDLAGKGGLTWIKSRTIARAHFLTDTVRGAGKTLSSNNLNAETVDANTLSAFTSSGFSLGTSANVNNSSELYASWSFREQPKFFDVVSWSGTGAVSQVINHNLGAVPGFIIVKASSGTSGSSNWICYHRSLGNTSQISLNRTDASDSNIAYWRNTSPTSTQFTVGGVLNDTSTNFVAYLFAHDAGGFGLTGTDNVISCGSYTGNGSATGPVVTLGYEPQWLLVKNASVDGHFWHMVDNMRGWTAGDTEATLLANTANTENGLTGAADYTRPTATGFQVDSASGEVNTSGATYIYIAIRRGPMKVPTTGTSVFQPVTYTGTNVDNRLVDTGIVTDMTMARIRNATSAGGFYTADRLRGNASLGTAITDAENTDPDSFMTPTVGYGNSFSAMNGFGVGNDATRQLNGSSTLQLAYAFRRASGFFDEVCYTGAGGNRTVAHNLAVVPELIIVKERNASGNFWCVYNVSIGNTNGLYFNDPNSSFAAADFWNNTTPTASVFTLGNNAQLNANSNTYVAYLFATCPGVSKVGTFTGTGTTQTIDCGFTAGARFILIKRTDSTGNWYVWDSARGLGVGNDPYLWVNSTNSQVTNKNLVDTTSTGFQVTNEVGNDVNVSGGTYIFLAIA